MNSIVFAIIMILGVFVPQALGAGLAPSGKGAGQAISPEKAWNPNPAPDDMILPMPCGGKFVLRPVAVHANGILSDYEIKMGIRNPSDKREYYEATFPGHINAPFTIADLPAAWQKTLQSNDKNIFYYLISKYEVSSWQWNAVMGDACPAQALTEADLRPKTDMTWYEVQAFLGKYNAWLLKEHKTSLPTFQGSDKDIGFLRLPMEEEWEYAARGGAKVSEESRNQDDFYPLQEYGVPTAAGQSSTLRLEDFAVYRSDKSYPGPLPIGSRKPNPLLIYDMAGNARELVDSQFRFSIADKQGDIFLRRLHGSPGGMICKGGSFSDAENAILPGWREEIPLLQANGVFSARNLGFRPVLSGINTPSSTTRDKLLEEAKKRLVDGGQDDNKRAQNTVPEEAQPPKSGPIVFDMNGNPATELDKIIETTDPAQRENLTAYRKLIAGREEASNRDKDRMLLGNLRNVLYQAELISEEAYRIMVLKGEGKKFEAMIKDPRKAAKTPEEHAKIENNPQLQQGIIERVKKLINDNDDLLNERDAVVNKCVNKYKEDITKLSVASAIDIKRHLEALRQEYAASDRLSTSLFKNIDTIQNHINQTRIQGIASLTKEQVKKDIIPKLIYP